MAEVFTIGETMVSFTPQEHAPLRYVSGYRPHIAGAESNVAIGLQKLGHTCAWMSRLGDDEFGRYIYNFVRGEGADVDSVVFDGEHPTGIMFKEVSQGETKVYYYRHLSAASTMKPEDLEQSSLRTAKILHLTGITPVLSEDCRRTVERAMEIAEENGIKISFDPNIRKKLWKDRDYSEVLREFCLRSDIVLLGLEEAEQLFSTTDTEEIFRFLFENGKAEYAAIKNGGDGAWVAGRDDRNPFFIPPYPCRCIDPIGAGDAFNSAFLAGVLEERRVEECGHMGAVAGALATETYGDIEGYPERKRLLNILNGQREIFR